ncbi:aldose 1-epimerase family protein [Microbacterium hominis]|uniref:aldose 1-epimerase family protein n=1 Tax=Microbacterium hominis TaxID=162426 RepID=UPI00196446D6|nr:aldose 1-epimerase family protein [Microbacterium hominis]QRY40104.1 aldose 1-epimerase family protein [Microbacterium hominis]
MPLSPAHLSATSVPASGADVTLRSGSYEAHIASVGASLRALTLDGRDLVVPFAADEVRPAYRGATLAPWPNRVVDGVYTFAGHTHRLALSDPGRPNALHGLAVWLDFDVVAQSEDEVTLATEIVPQAGYPWRLHVETTYRLSGDGLTQTVAATNRSADAAPFGTGPHPYLVAGPARLDEWTLDLPAGQVLEVTDAQLAPIGLADVTGSPRFDWRAERTLGDVEIDHAFTGLQRTDGAAVVRLTDPSGTGVEMVWDAACPWVQIHTADLPPRADGSAPAGHRAGLAVEPMTCAPDAFNAERYDYDAGLVVIEPGATAAASWRIAGFAR